MTVTAIKKALYSIKVSLLLGILICINACTSTTVAEGPKLFTTLDSDDTNIAFANILDYNKDFNIYTYRNFYNGGGIAIGDVNKDGLMDIYFTGNMQPNRLYLNQGDFKFLDITEQAGVGGEKAWSTGAVMADVNGDGWLDIYVCNSGDIEGDNKQNELFINQGFAAGDADATKSISFKEEAGKFGLADVGYGTHAAFFDYDKDGDLDAYLLNNSYRSIFDFNLKKNQRPVRDSLGGDKFFRNDMIPAKGEPKGVFTDISEEAGIYGSEIGFGLGVTVGDVNRDGWLDIFVSNDFFERDYLYINQADGTFKEDLTNQIQSLSVASMGADMADINNDGYPEIFVTEMLPEGEARFKTKMTFENWDKYQLNLKNGYYHQFTRNVLQLNNGDGTFSEIGRMAGVEATDWSWGALIADYDNDGASDLYVSNGLYQDIIDQDFIQFISNEEIAKQVVTKEGINYKKLIDTIPSNPVSNYMFKNTGDLSFKNVAAEWGLNEPSYSNGSAYADLDNDGDLDLIVNNVNSEASVFRNESREMLPANNFLKVELKGTALNTFAVGANITLKAGKQRFYLENIPTRGFQSSVDYRANFGLGKIETIDTLEVRWPDGKTTIKTQIKANQLLVISQEEAQLVAPVFQEKANSRPLFQELTRSLPWQYRHQENRFVDFDRDRLIYHMLSTDGPKITVGDVNGDQLEDFFIGGAAGMPSKLFVQDETGNFQSTNELLFQQEAQAEDLDCIFFDADNDGDQDLYVTRGGNEFLINPQLLVDQLYFNDGQGNLSRSNQFLPTLKMESSSCVQASDYDGDGDLDLFVGIRVIPGYYGVSANAYILNNDGKGKFTNVTPEVVPDLQRIGMVTDVLWLDIDQDEDEDLIVVGEWMPISVFENEGGKLKLKRQALDDPKSHGWWNCLRAGDFDNDGDLDLIVGNHGLNSRFSASKDKPVLLHMNDFDKNGTPEQLISLYNGTEAYPLALRHDLVMQLPALKKKYLKYHDYKEQTVEDIFNKEQLKGTLIKEVYNLESSIMINKGDGSFELKALPKEAQFAPTYGLLVEDVDQDGNQDVVIGGNLYGVKPEVGRYDANYGLVLKGKGDGSFIPVKSKFSGLNLKGQVRDITKIKVNGEELILVAKNNEPLQVFSFR